MSSSSNTKNKGSKDKTIGTLKVTKSITLNNDMQILKMNLMGIIPNYDSKMKFTYLDSISTKSRITKEDERHCPSINLSVDSFHRQILKGIHWKNFSLSGDALPAFLGFCEKYYSLNSIRLEDAQLNEDDIEVLSKYLKGSVNVTELNLSGNPYQKNFNYLISEGKLKYLTLKFCKITYENLVELLTPLKKSQNYSLIHLNLSHNSLDAKCGEEIAKVLRINRMLISLNLCGNNITDKGAKEIFEAFQMFRLNQEEISKRRKIYYQYYSKKYEHLKATSPQGFSIEGPNSVTPRNSVISGSRSRNRKLSKIRQRSSSKTSSKIKDFPPPPQFTSISMPLVADISDLSTMLDFKSAYHPFVKDTSTQGFEFICKGNFVLRQLNISYNGLTFEILDTILDVLKYQAANISMNEGLQNINLQGNTFKSEDSDAKLQEINQILGIKNVKSFDTIISIKEAPSKKDKKKSKSQTL